MTSKTNTSAQNIFDEAPIGALIRFSDGTPRPPDRFKRKLQAWENANGTGRLSEKTPGSDRSPGMFTLHIGDITGNSGVKLVQFFRTYSVHSAGTFTIEGLPAPEAAAA
ncbi:MAG: hypothetical protein WC807_16620 [Hyphomicrobium sp.]|jgi:hypothetical protein